MAWDLFSKGKKKAPSKVLKPKKDFRFIWVKAYRDVYATIREQDDSEQFEQKLQIIKARIRELNKKLIILLGEIRTL